jgi:hypothetical protein
MQTFDPNSVLDGRMTCRTLSDALDKLGILDGEKIATIYAREISCPSGETLGIVLIGTASTGAFGRQYLRMPDSKTFRGMLEDRTPILGPVHELDGGTVDSDGAVSLSDGRRIRSVRFQRCVPYRHYEFSPIQHIVVHLAIKLLGEEERCYRPMDPQLLPDIKLLDYGAIRSVRIQRAKHLLYLIWKGCGSKISWPEIANTLRLAGMQFPRSRLPHR